MKDKFKTLIVSASVVETARALASTWPGGVGMWQRELSSDGTSPATHYISSGKMNADLITALEAGAAAIVAMIQAQDPDSTVTEAEIQAILDGADISDDQPFEAMDRLGLQFVEEEDGV